MSTYEKPIRKILPFVGLLLFILCMGIFSLVDAWGNLFGFIYGFVYSAGALPYATHLQIDGTRCGKVKYVVWVFFRILQLIIIVALAAAFWIFPELGYEIEHKTSYSTFDCAFPSSLCQYVDPEKGVIEYQ